MAFKGILKRDYIFLVDKCMVTYVVIYHPRNVSVFVREDLQDQDLQYQNTVTTNSLCARRLYSVMESSTGLKGTDPDPSNSCVNPEFLC